MTKQTKMLVGVGLVGVAAYLLWKSQQPKATANASGKLRPRVLPKPISDTIIPNCPNCNKDGKCVQRGMGGAYGGNGVVVNCVNSNSGGAY
jgi:hypothetical protein